jgi:twin arginine-targeting protein translocase TatB
MFDLGWTELLVLGAVAIIVVGPKDLPKLMRSIGQISRQVKRMAGEFRSALDEAGRSEEIASIKKDFSSITDFDIDPTGGEEKVPSASKMKKPSSSKTEANAGADVKGDDQLEAPASTGSEKS